MLETYPLMFSWILLTTLGNIQRALIVEIIGGMNMILLSAVVFLQIVKLN